MGFEEAFGTMFGIVTAILLMAVIIVGVAYLYRFCMWVSPYVKTFVMAHPIWSVVIGIVAFASIMAAMQN